MKNSRNAIRYKNSFDWGRGIPSRSWEGKNKEDKNSWGISGMYFRFGICTNLEIIWPRYIHFTECLLSASCCSYIRSYFYSMYVDMHQMLMPHAIYRVYICTVLLDTRPSNHTVRANRGRLVEVPLRAKADKPIDYSDALSGIEWGHTRASRSFGSLQFHCLLNETTNVKFVRHKKHRRRTTKLSKISINYWNS